MIKKLAIGIGVIVVAIAIGAYWLAQNAGQYVKAAVEKYGSETTQVAVGLDAADVNLTDLNAALRGLSVGNPQGFNTDRAISLGEISVKIASVSTDLIVIDEVMIRAPEITYEIGAGGSNIAKIQENVDKFLGNSGQSGSSGESAANNTSSDEDQAGPQVIINDLYIKGGKVNVSATLFQGSALPVPLPDIHLEDIGKDGGDEGGATPAEVVDQIISAITDKAGGAASSLDLSQIGLSDISGKAAELGGAAADAAKGALEGASDKLGGAGGAVGEKLGGAGDALGGAVKGLFGN